MAFISPLTPLNPQAPPTSTSNSSLLVICLFVTTNASFAPLRDGRRVEGEEGEREREGGKRERERERERAGERDQYKISCQWLRNHLNCWYVQLILFSLSLLLLAWVSLKIMPNECTCMCTISVWCPHLEAISTKYLKILSLIIWFFLVTSFWVWRKLKIHIYSMYRDARLNNMHVLQVSVCCMVLCYFSVKEILLNFLPKLLDLAYACFSRALLVYRWNQISG